MPSASLESHQKHIADLVDFARQAGQPDAYHGKRANPRYRLKMPLELMIETEQGQQALTAELNDISLTGFGFWCESPFKPHVRFVVREWSPERASDWIPARIVHCSRGLTGFLIGAVFDVPKPSARPVPVAETDDDDVIRGVDEANQAIVAASPADQHPHGKRILFAKHGPRGISLRGKCSTIAIIGSLVGSVAAALVLLGVTAGQSPAILVPAAAIGAASVSGILMWLLLSDETRYFQMLRSELDSFASTGKMSHTIIPPPTRDLESIDQVLQRMRDELGRQNAALNQQRMKIAALDEVESTILNVVAHDLRTPLTSILLYSELLRTELHKLDSHEQEHCLQVIAVETQRLSRLIDNLTNAQKVAAGQIDTVRAPVSMPKILEECLRDYLPMAESKQISLEVDCDPNMPTFECDPSQVAQIVGNLIANALKFTPSGRCVAVFAEMHAHELVLYVSDNGPGIAREHWDRIFDRFTQINPTFVGDTPGVGVGLYVVRQIVDRLGGRIWLDSEVGKGTEFCVALPRDPATAEQTPQSKPRGRVLVCDADAELASRIEKLLRTSGLVVELAHSGARLLEKLADREFDVVLTDTVLPDLSPDELLKRLCDPQRSFKVIAHTHAREAVELRRRGIDIVLSRPADKAELLQTVELSLNLKPNCATIMIVAPEQDPLCEYGQRLAGEGHLPVLVSSIPDAAKQLSEYPFDRVLVAEEMAGGEWEAIETLARADGRPEAIVVVCKAVSRRERKFAEQLGVGAATIGALAQLSQALGEPSAV